jgi:hypothetical protein
MTRTSVRRALCIGLVPLAVLTARAQQKPIDTPGFTPDDFFQPTRVWTAHLTFTNEQWNAMQPAQGARGAIRGGGMQGPPGSRNGVTAMQGIEFNYVHADLELDGKTFTDVAVRYKGNQTFMASRASGKISLKVDLNKYVKGQKLAGLSTINFENDINDLGWMTEAVSYRLYRDAGVPAPRTSYARIYITVPGKFTRSYFGLYSILENVDTNFANERFAARTGMILKPSTRSPFTNLGDDWSSYQQTYDPKTDLTDDDTKRVIDLCKLTATATDTEFAARIGGYVDIDEFARYFAVLVWIGNSDSLLGMGQNYYVVEHPKTHKFMFVPWDQDFSFGNRGGINAAQTWTIYYPWMGQNAFLGRMYAYEPFRTAYLGKMQEFTKTIFRAERFAEQTALIGPAIRPAVQEEGAQWVAFMDQVTAGQAGIVPFARARNESVLAQLATGGGGRAPR